MAPKVWLAIARAALMALLSGLFLGFGLAFNPVWANGWPFGLSIYAVWSTWMSLVFFLLLFTTAVAIGAATGAMCAHFDSGPRRGRVDHQRRPERRIPMGKSLTLYLGKAILVLVLESPPRFPSHNR
jgi:hypothetical protein